LAQIIINDSIIGILDLPQKAPSTSFRIPDAQRRSPPRARTQDGGGAGRVHVTAFGGSENGKAPAGTVWGFRHARNIHTQIEIRFGSRMHNIAV
jgi:hypothetical protein